MLVGKALGVRWKANDRPEILEPGDGPSIAELSDGIVMPIPGGDTLAASRAVLARLETADSP